MTRSLPRGRKFGACVDFAVRDWERVAGTRADVILVGSGAVADDVAASVPDHARFVILVDPGLAANEWTVTCQERLAG